MSIEQKKEEKYIYDLLVEALSKHFEAIELAIENSQELSADDIKELFRKEDLCDKLICSFEEKSLRLEQIITNLTMENYSCANEKKCYTPIQ